MYLVPRRFYDLHWHDVARSIQQILHSLQPILRTKNDALIANDNIPSPEELIGAALDGVATSDALVFGADDDAIITNEFVLTACD